LYDSIIQFMLYSILRIIKFAFQDLIRNISLSIMTVLILVLMLLSINTLLVIRLLTSEAISLVEKEIDVSVFFDNDAADNQIQEVLDYVSQFPEVVDYEYLSKDAVLAEFKDLHQDNPEILASLDELGDNPLGSTLVIRTRAPSDYKKIIDAMRVPEYENIIEAKTFGDTETAIQRIGGITTQVERFIFGLSALFVVIAFLIIFNTFRVSIYTQRTEISIKKLVGATDWFVRGPYMIEALIFSVVGVIITFGILFLTLGFIDPYVEVVFEQAALLTNYFTSNILTLLGIQFGAVLLLTVFSSLLAMRRHLRV